MLVCQTCGTIISGRKEGHYYCNNCGKVTYHLSVRFK